MHKENNDTYRPESDHPQANFKLPSRRIFHLRSPVDVFCQDEGYGQCRPSFIIKGVLWIVFGLTFMAIGSGAVEQCGDFANLAIAAGVCMFASGIVFAIAGNIFVDDVGPILRMSLAAFGSLSCIGGLVANIMVMAHGFDNAPDGCPKGRTSTISVFGAVVLVYQAAQFCTDCVYSSMYMVGKAELNDPD
eukprot:TRINITY_DN12006_c1_g2_i1.p1 TRINITY_DN12006_c1_g2~~TRINITY_DN12006_c1_g2_i1.p1  ORF type:complete len:190 (+),score=21.96 TRINITY_DN12006_c1_g2_i1:98-667(+)